MSCETGKELWDQELCLRWWACVVVQRLLINKERKRGIRFVKTWLNDSFAWTVTIPARVAARGHGAARSGLINYWD